MPQEPYLVRVIQSKVQKINVDALGQIGHNAGMRRTPANRAESGADAEPEPKELRFVAAAQKDMREMPEEIKDGFGYGLWLIQQGETPTNASPFEAALAAIL